MRPKSFAESLCISTAASQRGLTMSSARAPKLRSLHKSESGECPEIRMRYDVVTGIDSDCLLCSNVGDVLVEAVKTGSFVGGRDGDGAAYDETYRIYGLQGPGYNQRYMSTALYFCGVTEATKRILDKWAQCCNSAVF